MSLELSKILKLQVKAESVWTDAKTASQYVVRAEAAKAVLENQTARVDVLRGRPDKDDVVKIMFLNTCDIKAEDCEPNCTIDEPQLSSGAEEYTIDTCKKTGFSIDKELIRTNEYEMEEQFAAGHAQSVKVLDEFWAQHILAQTATNAGYNAFPDPYTFNPALMRTEVPFADYNLRTLTAELLQHADFNNINSPYFIDNGLLRSQWINAGFDSGNFDGKGDAERLKAWKMYFDLLNFRKSGVTTHDLFMIDRSAVALVTKNRHKDTPEYVGGKIAQTRYTVPSPTLPGIRYDVYHELTCKTINGKSHDVYAWRYETQGLYAVNPALCPVTGEDGETYTTNGILGYKRMPA